MQRDRTEFLSLLTTGLCNGTEQGMTLVTVVNKSEVGRGLALVGLLTVWWVFEMFCLRLVSSSALWRVVPGR